MRSSAARCFFHVRTSGQSGWHQQQEHSELGDDYRDNSAAKICSRGITGGGQPWSTLGGRAYVNLTSSLVVFSVKGLVLAGGNTIGTPGAINQVEGTLVCNAGTASQAIIDTPAVTLDPQGNASFKGSFSMPTDACGPSAVAFLIRIPTNQHWIANGAVQVPYP